MRRNALLVGIAIVVLALAAWGWSRRTEDRPGGDDVPVGSQDATTKAPSLLATGDPLAGRQNGAKGTTPPTGSSAAAAATPSSGVVSGVVTESGGGPIAKARVRVALTSGGDLEQAAVETDAAGRFTVTLRALAALAPERRGGFEVDVRADAAGHRPARKWMDVPADAVKPVVVDVSLERGAALRGRVLAIDGSPAVGVWVHLCEGMKYLVQDAAGDDGRYSIPITFRGTVRVMADGRGASPGAAESNPIAVVPDLDVEVPDLRLAGEGSIEGRAVHPDGKPAAFLVVDVVAVDGDAKGNSGLGCASASGGLPGRQGRTGADGRFRFTGLEPGRYVLSPLSEHRTAEDNPDDIHATGDRNVSLVSRTRRLLVAVRDEQGRAVLGSSSDAKASGGADDSSFSGAGIFSVGDEVQAFDVDRGATFVFDVDGGGLEGHGETAIPMDAWETTLDVVAKRASPRGRLEVIVVDEAGKTLPFHVEASVHKEGGVYVITSTSFSSADGPQPSLLKAGTYDLTITPGSADAPAKAGPPVYFPVARAINLVGGETSAVKVVAKRGGALRVTMRPPEGVDIVRPTMRLVPATGGDPQPIESLWIEPDGRGILTNDVKPGVAQTYARPLAPGRYTLVVELPGLRPASVPVDITVGEVADANVVLAKE